MKLRIAVTAQQGFGYINHQDVKCPKCGEVSNLLLPGQLLDVRV